MILTSIGKSATVTAPIRGKIKMASHGSPISQLVVIGASAGGVEALSRLVTTLNVPFPAPIVVAQHLDPSRPSQLTEILGRKSTLDVITVQDSAALEAGTIYVVPSNKHVEI